MTTSEMQAVPAGNWTVDRVHSISWPCCDIAITPFGAGERGDRDVAGARSVDAL
jgi:hypothetical protein